MLKGYTDFVYVLGFRNGRYEEGKWRLSFFESYSQREIARRVMEGGDGEFFECEFAVCDVVPAEKMKGAK